MMNDYVPIDCAAHSELELLALHRVAVTIECGPDGEPNEHIEGVVVDIETRSGAEYLVVRAAGGTQRVRLDRLCGIATGGRRIFPRQ